jgi:hypothetical protein
MSVDKLSEELRAEHGERSADLIQILPYHDQASAALVVSSPLKGRYKRAGSQEESTPG